MRNLKKYSNHSGYSADERALGYNVSICKSENHTHYDKPYDSKVEYLKSTGTQWIDTLIIPDANTGIMVEFARTNSTDSYMVGCRNDGNNTRWSIGTDTAIYYGYSSFATLTGIAQDTKYIAYLNFENSKKFSCSVTSTELSLPSLSFTPLYNIRLFGSAGVVANYTKWSGKIFAVKVTQGSELVLDLIPVRKGQVGYMYDKISKRLFGNSGTGTFTLGPDI